MVQWRRRKKIVRKEPIEGDTKKEAIQGDAKKEVVDGDAREVAVQWRRKEEVIGKEVVDGDAKKIGMTKDIAWSEDGKLALVIESDDNEFILPFLGIEKIGDVIFVKLKDSLEKVPSVTCPRCKTKNPQDTKFCSKCGHKLEAESHAPGDKEKNPSETNTDPTTGLQH